MSQHRLHTLTAILMLLCTAALEPARASSPPCRYQIANGTALDLVTGLRWQQALSGVTYGYTAAQTYCGSLSYGRFSSGWRAPTTKELLSLVDYTASAPATDTSVFPGAPSASFWTATPYQGNVSSGQAWAVNFTDGSANPSPLTNPYYIRCVH